MRILLAEPSKIGRIILTQMLEGDGHSVICVENAEDALAQLEADDAIDVLLTAIEFIGMSGLELCWSARLLASNHRSLCIIVMSASTDEAKLAEALDTGADDFIGKPPRKTELLARLRSGKRMLDAQRELIRIASFDALTGLRNRRVFFESIAEAELKPDLASVLILDVDYFKQVNDRHGHDGGDIVLQEVARRLQRIDSRFSRIGGEEFALLVRGPLEMAAVIAETARREIALLPVKLPDTKINVTISLGVAQREPGTTFEQAIKDADIALYASKSGGRNRVTIARVNGQTANFEAPQAMDELIENAGDTVVQLTA
jgi:two-component system, cell cycle response regulator